MPMPHAVGNLDGERHARDAVLGSFTRFCCCSTGGGLWYLVWCCFRFLAFPVRASLAVVD